MTGALVYLYRPELTGNEVQIVDIQGKDEVRFRPPPPPGRGCPLRGMASAKSETQY